MSGIKFLCCSLSTLVLSSGVVPAKNKLSVLDVKNSFKVKNLHKRKLNANNKPVNKKIIKSKLSDTTTKLPNNRNKNKKK